MASRVPVDLTLLGASKTVAHVHTNKEPKNGFKEKKGKGSGLG
jgi:hypothetical protein